MDIYRKSDEAYSGRVSFLPAIPADLAHQGIRPGDLDVVLVTGDAYVDHSSFGASLIGRLLQDAGYRVGILPRPDPDDVEAFRLLGKPRLAFLVTAGSIDSMVANYTANLKPRSEDDYAPRGDPSWCLRSDGTLGPGIRARRNSRPDRATIAYSGMCKRAFKGVPVVLGGIEASLRRLSHYDVWSDTVRRSVLLDSKADILVYGMGETAILEILGRMAANPDSPSCVNLQGIRGTVHSIHHPDGEPTRDLAGDAILLPSHEELAPATQEGFEAFNKAFALQYANTEAASARRLAQVSGARIVIQEPPAFPLQREELDRIYALPFQRAWHPMYRQAGGIPAFSEVKFSILSSRGCFGACSFCSLASHQGRVVNSRSHESILAEAKILVSLPDFKGYIHDVGGPTANFRRPSCKKASRSGACTDRRCLAPEPCQALEVDHSDYRTLLSKLRSIPGVKKVFIRSGIRFDYLVLDRNEDFFRDLVRHHVSGQLKVAPEHVSEKVLSLMGKPPHRVFDAFSKRYTELSREEGLPQYLVSYFISAHPGSSLTEAVELAEYLRDTGASPEQVQDFYATPGTLSTAMYRTGKNPLTGEEVYVPRGARERAMQRALLQYFKPENADLVREALRLAGREDLVGSGPSCLVRGSRGQGNHFPGSLVQSRGQAHPDGPDRTGGQVPLGGSTRTGRPAPSGGSTRTGSQALPALKTPSRKPDSAGNEKTTLARPLPRKNSRPDTEKNTGAKPGPGSRKQYARKK